jgi:hypothetical protein
VPDLQVGQLTAAGVGEERGEPVPVRVVSLDVACLDRTHLNGYVCPERGRGLI